ncbi:MAG: hypothetical protein A2908_01815 [Candidatus Staskawiczbacteria bacterium RIFCSPLOWO2_01_FULL_38_12b]|uniref:Response regulatory domain-containing protein n=1 Tax=Candidatus Staskawiczbacteria bacterium RIFCSPLOWO2_01_FULL_38_12b TaxID=1802214 RepID=A0A1G2IEB8_9BACT|nr:MAG: hypothetical protein A2908_01815 [Candidatus Staskawiczbacteria bacterium RIFCSPLOWO2_01_FULL_38_12b]QBM02594.1 regulator of RpoS [uncultured archaeon]
MKKILLVEDDPFIVDIYANQFRKEGFLIDTAKDGKMALEKLKNNYPDLLVLDIILPNMDGWELLRTIRSDQSLKNLKVIIVSNLDKQEHLDDIAHLGVIKYFLKIQSTPEDIIKAVKEILK